MRLDRWLSEHSQFSRREAKLLIKARRIAIDGIVATSSNQPLSADERVELDGVTIEPNTTRYLALNKPLGVICATSDSHQQTVIDLIPKELRAQLHPVGRLDKDTTGLVILTSDGQWSHRVTHPKYACEKQYEVTTKWPINAELVFKLQQGVILKDSDQPAVATTIRQLDTHKLLLGISEGRYHQVRRMIAACSNRVEALHRQAIGPLQLDLEPGKWRHLKQTEIDLLA